MKVLKYHSEVLDLIFTNYLKEFKFKVDYYSNLHDPEFRYNHGVSIESKLESSLKDYENAKFTAKISKEILEQETEITCLDRYSFLEAIKQGIREQMKFAYDYSENKYIVVRAYKRAIKLLQVLNLNTDNYKHVTARYFLYSN
jgi:predicted DNA binding CopG/RHH family protein